MTHPMGSFRVMVRFRLGLAWLMGMVAPWKKQQHHREGLWPLPPSPVGIQPAPGTQGGTGAVSRCPRLCRTGQLRGPEPGGVGSHRG